MSDRRNYPKQIASPPIPLLGLLDLISPAVRTNAGSAVAAVNYEPHARGFRRIDGYERFDGQPAPSAASYSVLNFTNGTATITTGQTVTGATSGATGKALIDAVVSTGAYGTSDAAGYLVLTTVSGTFVTGENLQVGGITKMKASGTATSRGATTDTNDSTWLQSAMETARALIAAVPGSGNVLGVWMFNGSVYAFRNTVLGTAAAMYKATTTGWSLQSLGYRVRFQTGSAAVTAGQTLTGATSGASAVVTRVVLRTGSYGASTAAGQFIFASITGAFTAGENLQVGGVTKAVANGASAAITLPANGRYEFVNHNFFGATNLKRMYGVNGVGTAFEWDGSVFVPLETGMTTDTPNHIAPHRDYLFLSFPGGSIQYSSVGNPYAWTAVLGAGEIGMGDDVTAMIPEMSTTLGIVSRNKTAYLTGTSPSDFSLQRLSDDSGAIEWTAQRVGDVLFMDNLGVRSLATTQKYGGFSMGTVTLAVEALIRAKLDAGITPVGSVRCRSKNQYRVFFSDSTGLIVYLGERTPKCLPILLDDLVTCCSSVTDSNGFERMFFGSSDGFVYEMDSGNNFDGGAVNAYFRLAFTHLGSPTLNKRVNRAQLELDAPAGTALNLVMEFDYGDPNTPPPVQQSFTVQGGGGSWNEDNWNEFLWSQQFEGVADCHIDGIGRNFSLTVISSLTYADPHIVHSLTYNYTPRGLVR